MEIFKKIWPTYQISVQPDTIQQSIIVFGLTQTHSQGGAGGAMHHHKSSKKSTIWGQKVHSLGAPHLPKIDPGYGSGLACPVDKSKSCKIQTTCYNQFSLKYSMYNSGVTL